MSAPSPPKPRGRPRDPAKAQAILDAARRVFLQSGPDAVTMDVLVAESGVSRMTLYSNFRDKDAVLEAVVRRESERVAADTLVQDSRAIGIDRSLARFGEGMLTLVFSPESFGFDRLVASLALHRPELAARFYDAGQGRARRLLEGLIREHVDAGKLRRLDPVQAASDLMGLWQGALHSELSYHLRPPLTPTQIRSQAKRGVDLFMKLYGPDTK